MKHTVCLLLSLCLTLSLCACGAEKTETPRIAVTEKFHSESAASADEMKEETVLEAVAASEESEPTPVPEEAATAAPTEESSVEPDVTPTPAPNIDPTPIPEEFEPSIEPTPIDETLLNVQIDLNHFPEIVGGYSLESNKSITSERQAIFSAGVAGTEAADYTPIQLIASQLVAGTNYLFLCTQPDGTKIFVIVYQNLNGVCSLNEITREAISINTGKPFYFNGQKTNATCIEDFTPDDF